MTCWASTQRETAVRCPAQSLAPLLSCESNRDLPVLGEQVSGRLDLAANTDASATSPSSADEHRSGRDGRDSQPTRLPASGHLNALPAPGWRSMPTCLRHESTQISNANRLLQPPSICFAMCDSRSDMPLCTCDPIPGTSASVDVCWSRLRYIHHDTQSPGRSCTPECVRKRMSAHMQPSLTPHRARYTLGRWSQIRSNDATTGNHAGCQQMSSMCVGAPS